MVRHQRPGSPMVRGFPAQTTAPRGATVDSANTPMAHSSVHGRYTPGPCTGPRRGLGGMSPTRDWTRARQKVDAEGACRACGTTHGLQAAHIVPRSRVSAGAGRGEDPRNIVPLCVDCHADEHNGRLELLPLLTLPEQGYIAELVGIEEARRRTTRKEDA